MKPDAVIKRMKSARRFPDNTCPASRHVAMMAEALCAGRKYAMLRDEPAHCGESMAATVAALWEARTRLAVERSARQFAEAQLEAVLDMCQPPAPDLLKNRLKQLAAARKGKDG